MLLLRLIETLNWCSRRERYLMKAVGRKTAPLGVEMLVSMRCLMLGHDDRLVRSPERLRLRCDHCRRETPGWALTTRETSRHPRRGEKLSALRGLPRLELSEHA
jgi:hypothetical protein